MFAICKKVGMADFMNESVFRIWCQAMSITDRFKQTNNKYKSEYRRKKKRIELQNFNCCDVEWSQIAKSVGTCNYLFF